jgi:hypothetical protein
LKTVWPPTKKLLPERLDALLNAKVSPIQVGSLFDRYFYEMVDDLDIIRRLCTIGERILSVCKDKDTVSNVTVKVLDGAFIVDNFDLAIHMLEEGIPGKDKAWHDMSLPKVKAHRAMAQHKPREAVKYFRQFMNAWIESKRGRGVRSHIGHRLQPRMDSRPQRQPDRQHSGFDSRQGRGRQGPPRGPRLLQDRAGQGAQRSRRAQTPQRETKSMGIQ